MKLLLPPNQEQTIQNQLVFLAGPIQSTGNWQDKFIEKFKDSDITIANPRREYLDGAFNYVEQVEWETYYLNKSNTIIFWLAKETNPIEGRAYAQTSRFELGEHLAKQPYNRQTNLIIGIEDGFSGGRYIRTRVENNYPWIPIVDTFEELVQKTKESLI